MNSQERIFCIILTIPTFLILCGWGNVASPYNDLIKKNKSDTGIKFLTAPLSLAVVQSRPLKGSYFFYDAQQNPHFDDSLSGDGADADEFDAVVSESRIIKKTLRSTDPTRLAPSSIGKDYRGPVTRLALRQLAKANPTDIIIIFRREIWVDGPGKISSQLFLQPAKMISTANGGFKLQIHSEALIYLARQDKILRVSPSKDTVNLLSSESKTQLQNIVRKGLQELADKARMIIRAQRKIVSKSY